MQRIYPVRIKDKFYLSKLLEQYLQVLAESPLQVSVQTLSYDTGIPQVVLERLAALHHNLADAHHINAADYHVVFANVMFRFPTIRMYAGRNGMVHFEL
jgi:hypothetical protein